MSAIAPPSDSTYRQMTGFSPRNLWFFKQFYETYADAPEFLKQAVSETPWGHNVLIMKQMKLERNLFAMFFKRLANQKHYVV
jgi:hypothetical protein